MCNVKQTPIPVIDSNINKGFSLARKKSARNILSITLLIIASIGFSSCANPGAVPDIVGTANSNPPTKVQSTFTTTPTNTSTPKPTRTPNLTATQRIINSTATANSAEILAFQANQWDLKLSDTFENNSNQWYSGKFNNEWGKGEIKIVDGKYRWTYSAYKGSVRRVWRYTTSLTNFILTVDIQEISGDSGNGEYGVVFRNSRGNDFYYFGIYPRPRQYFFSVYNKDKWTTLIDPTRSLAINLGEPNEITLIAQDSHFIFFINKQFVAEISDDTLTYGPMGLVAGLAANNEGVFEFDNIVLRTLPK